MTNPADQRQMRGILVEELGGPEDMHRVMQVRHDLSVPEASAGEVRVKVEAVGVNFADALAVSGEYLTRTRLPYTPGMEFAGVIDQLGEGVTGLQVGQRVACLGGLGGLAEYALVRAAAVIPVPPSYSAAQAAAFPVSYLTAYHGLRTLGQAQAGEWVWVQAAAGALGTASIQLAKALQLNVIATASTAQKLDLARQLGADVTILQDDPEVVQQIRDASGGGVHLVLEVVGGRCFQESLDAARNQGRIVVIGNASREQANLRPVELMKRNLSVTGLWLTSLMAQQAATRDATQALHGLLSSGQVTPQVGPVYALAESAQAFQDILNRKTTGKVIIEPGR